MTETKSQDKPGAIYPAMIAIASEMPSISKIQKNDSQGYVFRGIDDVFNALQPILAKHGVFMTAEILDLKREERPTKSGGIMAFVTTRVRYSFVAKDGSSISTESAGEGADAGDKATAKSLSIAMKYALLQAFMIPTADAKDPEVDSPDLPPVSRSDADEDFMDEPATPAPFDKLPDFVKAKKALGDKAYYEILGQLGVEHANEIAVEKRASVLKTMRAAFKVNKGGTK
jgi:hypothetical protein